MTELLDCLKSYSQTMFVSRMRQEMTMMQQGSSPCTQSDIDWLLRDGEFSGQCCGHRHRSIWICIWIEAGTNLLSVKNLVNLALDINCGSRLRRKLWLAFKKPNMSLSVLPFNLQISHSVDCSCRSTPEHTQNSLYISSVGKVVGVSPRLPFT